MLEEYFIFSRKERIGMLVVVILIVLIWISPQLIPPKKSQLTAADTSWMTAISQAERARNATEDSDANVGAMSIPAYIRETAGEATHKLFPFDPNTLSAEGWGKLGIRQKIITTIQKYLRKGGHFYKPQDLKKIYGVRDDEYLRLEPYIKIESQKEMPTGQNIAEPKKHEIVLNPRFETVDINGADSSAFVSLPGIGSKLARRIMDFREKLGGFYSINQISEVYGLADSSFQKIRPWLKLGTLSIRKININSVTAGELKAHPYFKWSLANAIVQYRNQHGSFSSVDDLKKITLITEETFEKIKAYLTL